MPTQTSFKITTSINLDVLSTVVLVGRKPQLQDSAWRARLGIARPTWKALLAATHPGDQGAGAETWVGTRKVVLGILPETCSRHNSPSRAWAIPALARRVGGNADAALVLLLDDVAHAHASVNAAARAFPRFNSATGRMHQRTLSVLVHGPDGVIEDPTLQIQADAVRMAALLVDTPTDRLDVAAFVSEARAVADALGVEMTLIEGEALREQGFGGLWGVGKAARVGPALVALRWAPEGATRHVAWVGKGIVYDTGGLSIKTKTGMPGMKGDMGGAAAVLAAFAAAVRQGVDHDITAVLCLAENAVGPDSVRPDDILTMKSGKTVEINNTDAEGRLVLADGVAWVAAQGQADLIIDMATLTGAALMATGKVHAALYCSDEAVEAAAVVAGRVAGEPCHALPYAPELFRKEFKSTVADMRNSVKDRMNAQSSCAGQFIANHLPASSLRYLHIDIAGPAWAANNRGTGYGVGLLLALGAGPAA